MTSHIKQEKKNIKHVKKQENGAHIQENTVVNRRPQKT